MRVRVYFAQVYDDDGLYSFVCVQYTEYQIHVLRGVYTIIVEIKLGMFSGKANIKKMYSFLKVQNK